jgi:hypothetical protein
MQAININIRSICALTLAPLRAIIRHSAGEHSGTKVKIIFTGDRALK